MKTVGKMKEERKDERGRSSLFFVHLCRFIQSRGLTAGELRSFPGKDKDSLPDAAMIAPSAFDQTSFCSFHLLNYSTSQSIIQSNNH
mmetsp:Transcript_2435/g.5118  ORF Transcript_2435/g.5118 Transcript_2435/m.5118 type:complete len:87 (-) Transcript_2435:123-383(-)